MLVIKTSCTSRTMSSQMTHVATVETDAAACPPAAHYDIHSTLLTSHSYVCTPILVKLQLPVFIALDNHVPPRLWSPILAILSKTTKTSSTLALAAPLLLSLFEGNGNDDDGGEVESSMLVHAHCNTDQLADCQTVHSPCPCLGVLHSVLHVDRVVQLQKTSSRHLRS